MSGLNTELSTSNDRMAELTREKREAADRLTDAHSRVSALQDRRQRFRQRVQGKYRDIVTAMDWLEANKGRLQGECYGPVGLYVEVR